MEDMVRYSKELMKEVMNDQGITLAELARRLGKDKSQIYRILNSESDMTLTTLDSIFKALGVKVGLLLEYE